jgi:hypothetical protein
MYAFSISEGKATTELGDKESDDDDVIRQRKTVQGLPLPTE